MKEHDEIIIALRRITRAIDLHSKRLVKTTGLTAPQLVILQALDRAGEASPSTLAKTVSLSQPTVTTILDRLERQGLLTRERSANDKRRVYVRLTDSGARAVSKGSPELLQAGFLREFRRLESWERHMLIAALQRVAELMDAQDLDAAAILDAGELLED